MCESLAGFQHAYGLSEVLRSGLLRLWAGYESQLASVLSQKKEPDNRYQAAQLVTLIRSVSWQETAGMAANKKDGLIWLQTWLEEKARTI